MQLTSTRMFWRAYWGIYDKLCKIRPYAESINQGVKGLNLKSGDKCLDVGCGTANSTAMLYRNGLAVVGMDNSEMARGIAAKKLPDVSFVFGDFNESFPFKDGEFAGVFAHNALYLAADPVKTFMEISRVLATGGMFVMSNPIPEANPFEILKEHVRMCKEEFYRETKIPFIARLKTYYEAISTFLVFLEFLPFTIALKHGGGGAANFWGQDKWETVRVKAALQGTTFETVSIRSGYGRQNLAFAFRKV